MFHTWAEIHNIHTPSQGGNKKLKTALKEGWDSSKITSPSLFHTHFEVIIDRLNLTDY
jgi:cytochrome c peroxidase